MQDQSTPQPEVVQLDQRETMFILSHAMIRKAIEKLPKTDQLAVYQARNEFYDLIAKHGDAARVAFQLFVMEFDNTKLPYGDTFEVMDMVPFDEAVRMWQDGFRDEEGS